jgi:hypothetical protein
MSENVKQEIETAILRALYGAWAERGDVSLNTVLEQEKWDVRALVNIESSFEELLNEKYKALVTRRQIVWR